MTKKQRAEVVELLRCAADQISIDHHPWHYAPLVDVDMALGRNTRGLNYPSFVMSAGSSACASVNCGFGLGSSPDRVRTCLEAAQRVEDGDWP